MITLSIIGSIAAIPSGSIENRIAMRPAPRVPSPDAEPLPEPQPAGAQPGDRSRPDRAGNAAEGLASAPPPETNDGDRWLEAITYALLALVGLAALACLVLWRGLRRIASGVARPSP
jgi:hypothetical protein